MKTILSYCFLLLGIWGIPQLSAQTLEEEGWPRQHEAVTLFTGTNGLASTVNLTFDHLFRAKKLHLGYSAGINYLFLESWNYPGTGNGENYLGPHFTVNMMTGKKANHFEAKIGASVSLIDFDRNSSSDKPIVPIISIGYRAQLPNKLGVFRISISSFLLGVGGGAVIGQQW